MAQNNNKKNDKPEKEEPKDELYKAKERNKELASENEDLLKENKKLLGDAEKVPGLEEKVKQLETENKELSNAMQTVEKRFGAVKKEYPTLPLRQGLVKGFSLITSVMMSADERIETYRVDIEQNGSLLLVYKYKGDKCIDIDTQVLKRPV